MNTPGKLPKPTESELQILSILWEDGPSTVRFVNDRLNEKKQVGYTTTLKFLQIMTDKGLVSRMADGRTHVYSSVIRKESVQSDLLDKLLATAFNGSAKRLVMQTLGSYKASREELKEIKNLINELEGGKK
ncbi:MAG: BlaI/MecI/CopY family transcriptional regulator [Bacteroidetes bacterium]|nr:BlaI/MecI/CopY family transcriptional regulator [Bacteroidota bacterium]